MSTFTRLLAAALPALILSACDTIPAQRGDEPAPVEDSSGVEAIPLEDSEWVAIEPSEHDPDPEAAIESSLRDALGSQPPRRQSAYLDASRRLIDIQRFEDAEAVLNQVIVSGLPPVHFARKRMQQAAIFLHRNDLERAGRYVEAGLRRSNIDPAYTAWGLDLKSRIELGRGKPLEAAKAWIRRHNYLSDNDRIAANNERIWHALGHLNAMELQLAGQTASDGNVQAWLDLAILVLEQGGDSHALQTAVTQWAQANRPHPAARFSEVLTGPSRAEDVRQIALLLPLSSEYGAAARTVYNGFDAAHATDNHPRRPQVVFYDIGGEASLAGNYVGAATSEGADVIVGPLGKAAVNALLESRQPERPMVLLGSASGARSPDTRSYQFDLSPEQEARQVAELMYASGHRRIGALYPDDGWGQRIHEAFVAHWEALGGTIAEARAYTPNADEHTPTIKNLFNLTESETRRSLLEARSGLNLNFEARRRRDIDALFMAARPDDARLLKPQINFYQGHDLPVYSTSHVYSGARDKVNDTDLDGIVFPDMPWALIDNARHDALENAIRDKGYEDATARLFAFGYDAYRLAQIVARPEPVRDTRFRGLTSTFELDGEGRLQRRPQWARFRDGVPQIIWRE